MEMLQDLEQARALEVFRGLFPKALRAIYEGCLEAGFSERQTMMLLIAYIMGQNPHGCQPASPDTLREVLEKKDRK